MKEAPNVENKTIKGIAKDFKEVVWDQLLILGNKIRECREDVKYCTLHLEENGAVTINEPNSAAENLLLVYLDDETALDHDHATVFSINNQIKPHIIREGALSREIIDFLKFYLPYCLLPARARILKRAITVSHFAQTLDGKIATNQGHSRWIGNYENLVHAHRMRAICDCILIGANTLKNDQPSLTVRHVNGPNPKRIVLCSSSSDYSCLFKNNRQSILILGTVENPGINNAEYARFPSENGQIKTTHILEYLFEKGFYTVYIEGGATTTSAFLKDKTIDILQLHISPVVFGSGEPSFRLPEISQVEDSINFKNFLYQPVGDTMMFIGQVNQNTNGKD